MPPLLARGEFRDLVRGEERRILHDGELVVVAPPVMRARLHAQEPGLDQLLEEPGLVILLPVAGPGIAAHASRQTMPIHGQNVSQQADGGIAGVFLAVGERANPLVGERGFRPE